MDKTPYSIDIILYSFSEYITYKSTIDDFYGVSTDYAMASGLLQFANNEMRILSDAVEGREELDVERAKQRAEQRFAKLDNKTNVKRAVVALAKAINRLRLSGDQ